MGQSTAGHLAGPSAIGQYGMVMRIVQVILGAALAGGGGYLAWLNRAMAPQLFPPDPEHAPWMLVAGLAAIIAGCVLVIGAALPRPNQAVRRAAETERRRAAIAAADVYYAERARAADRDWRSGDLPAEPATPTAAPISKPAAALAPSPPSRPADPARDAPVPPPADRQPVDHPAAALSEPPPAFPSAATLQPIPSASNGPPPPVAVAPPAAPALVFDAAATPAVHPEAGAFAPIRAALTAGRLDDADRLLTEERTRLAAGGADSAADLAELTGLAGDHAAALGRTGGARWLWRLSLQRFAAVDAIGSPAARAVAERLRLSGQ